MCFFGCVDVFFGILLLGTVSSGVFVLCFFFGSLACELFLLAVVLLLKTVFFC